MVKYIKLIKKEIFIRLFFHYLYVIAIAALPYVIKNMIDSKFDNGLQDVIIWTIIFVSFIIIGMLSQYITQRTAWKIDKIFYEEIRADLFRSIILKNPKEFVKKDIGDYSSEINNDIAACEEYIEYGLLIIESVIGLVVYAVYVFNLNYKIAIVIYIAALLVVMLPKITGDIFSDKKQYLLEKTGEYNTKLIDLLKGYEIVDEKTYLGIVNRHNEELKNMENARYSFGKFKTFVNVLNGSVMYIINISAFVIIAVLLFRKNITAGVATATIAYIQSFMSPLRTLIDAISNLKSVKGTKERILNEINEEKVSNNDKISFNKNITLENIYVSYNDFCIKNFSYNFEKGKKYAIIGTSGTGKSTIIKLIMKFIEPDKGKIKVDGKSLDYSDTRKIMAYLNQNSYVYMDTFEDNVTVFGVYENNDNYNATIISKNTLSHFNDIKDCSSLSGGEQQIVNILRIINSKKEILILDEPFSALDKKTERELCEKLLRIKDKTIIMVTHNTSIDVLNLFDEIIDMKQYTV